MKISVNGVELFELSETQKKVIQDDIPESMFEADMRRRVEWVLMHKYEECFKALHREWLPKLSERVESVPTNPDAFAALVFSQEDYRSRQQKIDEEKRLRKQIQAEL